MDVSFQLYSARDGGPWEQTIPMLAQMGYTQVEGYGGVYGDIGAFRALLDANGMTMPSGHISPVEEFETDFDGVMAKAKTLGIQRLFCPAPNDDFRNGAPLEDWKALGLRLEAIHARVSDAGLRFGWHNHHWEFLTKGAMETLLDHAPSMEWEADIAWIVRGGADPLDMIAQYGSRMTTAHIKDIAPEGDCQDEDGWADVGQGVMDWPALMTALRGAGVDLFIAEHDKPSDTARFAQRSIDAIKGY